MEVILKVLQGAYAYLLIFLVAVVSGHFLLLLWLIARRIREAAVGGAELGAGAEVVSNLSAMSVGSATAAAVSPSPTPEMAPTIVQGVPVEEVEALKKELTQLKSERTEIQATLDSSSELKERVKYLESKLLEYEILQEEITALSALKVENEELKKKLHVENTPSEAPIEAKPEAKTDLKPEVKVESKPDLKVVKIEDPPASNKPSESEVAQLENLLSQIDELTRDGKRA